MEEISVELRGISKSFGRQQVVRDVSLQIGRGEFFSLLGPSGCGKTTLLRILAGFEAPDAGRVLLNGEDITDLPPNRLQVLLLDEPLAALDLKLRQRMLIELDLIHDEVGITFLYVTHDQGEAMSLSDRIAVMNAGRIEQVGRSAEINKDSYPLISEEIRNDPSVFLPLEVRAKCEIIQDLGADNAKYTKVWDEIKAAE